MKYLSLALTGAMSFWLVSCDQSKTSDTTSTTSEETPEVKKIPAKEGADLVQAKSEAEQDAPVLVSTTLSVDDWKANAPTASEMDEIQMMKKVVGHGAKDPEAAVNFLVDAPHSPRRFAALRAVAAEWVRQDKAAVMEKAESLEDEKVRAVMRMAVIHNTPVEQLSSAKEWINTWPEDASERAAALEVIHRKENPEEPHVCGPECLEHAQ